MKKIGRNDPCPCGSGRKYKRCCLSKDELSDEELRGAVRIPGAEVLPDGSVQVYTPLDLLSNRANDLIREGQLDEAEKACRELRRRYPDGIDWVERTAQLYAARGDAKQAAEHYRRAAEIARVAPGFGSTHLQWLLDEAQALDPVAP